MANKKMLTTEDYNSIEEHFSNGFIDYYEIDTSDVETEDTIYGYDFLTIIQTTNKITALIDNALWSGGYYLIDSNLGDNISISADDDGLVFNGTGLTWVKFGIELSPEIKRNHQHMYWQVDYPIYIRPFYKNFNIELTFTTTDGTAYPNLLVKDGNTSYYTDDEGQVQIPISAGGEVGKHNRLLKIGTYEDEVNLYYRIIKAEYRVGPYDTLYRYMEDRFTFRLFFTHSEALQETQVYSNNDIYLLINGTKYEMQGHYLNDMYFDLPAFSSEEIDVKFVVNGNDYIQAVKYDYTVELPIKEYNSWGNLIIDSNRERIPSVVKYTSNTISNSGWGLLPKNNLKIIFTEDIESIADTIEIEDCKIVLENLNIDGLNFKIKLEGGELELNNCSFSHCSDIIIEGDGNVILNNVSFVDNASCINITGNLTADNCLFELADDSYVDITKIPFIRAFGDVNINDSMFNLELNNLEELGYSYVCMMINNENTTNGVDNNKLTSNNAFNMKNNSGNVQVTGNGYNINAVITWILQNSNTVCGNNLKVISVED